MTPLISYFIPDPISYFISDLICDLVLFISAPPHVSYTYIVVGIVSYTYIVVGIVIAVARPRFQEVAYDNQDSQELANDNQDQDNIHKSPIESPSFINLAREAVKETELTTKKELTKLLRGRIATYKLPNHKYLTVVRGNIIDFEGTDTTIVNSTNERCLGGGGVDKAISEAGGTTLREARKALPLVGHNVRCPTGDVKMVGPNSFGSLLVPYILLAVGPDYRVNHSRGDSHLRAVYTKCCKLAGKEQLKKLVFPLISAGTYRGEKDLKEILKIAVESVHGWSKSAGSNSNSVNDVIFCIPKISGYRELVRQLVSVCDEEFAGYLKVCFA